MDATTPAACVEVQVRQHHHDADDVRASVSVAGGSWAVGLHGPPFGVRALEWGAVGNRGRLGFARESPLDL